MANNSQVKIVTGDRNNIVALPNLQDSIKDEPSRIIVSSNEDTTEPMYVVMAPNNTQNKPTINMKQRNPQLSLNTLANAAAQSSHGQHFSSSNDHNPDMRPPAMGAIKTTTPRDDHRRKQHNEVERRRRDKINAWIMRLAKIVPECNEDHTKQGQSKGGILHKTYDYIITVVKENEELINKLNNSTGIGGMGNSPEDAYAMRMSAIEKENRQLKQELKHAREDRDDIIHQLKAQGIGLTMRPVDEDYEDELPDQISSAVSRASHHQNHDKQHNMGDGVVVIGNDDDQLRQFRN